MNLFQAKTAQVIVAAGLLISANACLDNSLDSKDLAPKKDRCAALDEDQIFESEFILEYDDAIHSKDLKATEGIAFSPDGRLFFTSLSGGLYELYPDGSIKNLVAVAHAVGLAYRDGEILMAMKNEQDQGQIGVYNLANQSFTTIDILTPRPNFLVATPWDTILISDDIDADIIWEYSPQAATTTIWVDNISTPNGMVFSHNGDELFVATTFEADPPVHRIEIENHAAKTTSVIGSFPLGTPDGLAIDANENIYIAINTPGELIRYDGVSMTVLNDDLEGIASIAFAPAGNPNWDDCYLYATRLLGGGVWKIAMDFGQE